MIIKTIVKYKFFSIVLILSFSILSFVFEEKPAKVEAVEPNPVEVEAIGEAYLGEIDTPKEIRERAKRDAESKAVEQAIGTFIRAHTLISNSQLAEDLIYASVRGKIERVEIINEGWDEKERNLYRVKIKAFIEPVYPEKGEGISLKVSLSKSILKEGEEVKIFYQANSDCYIYIFSVAADGSVTLLLPNKMNQNNHVESGKAYQFPPPNSPIHLHARFLLDYKEPVAEERIKIIATKKKEDLIPLGFCEGMFHVYDSKSTGMISDLVKRLSQLDPTEWAEASAEYKLIK